MNDPIYKLRGRAVPFVCAVKGSCGGDPSSVSSVVRSNMASSQLVQSHGPFQGLPTYPQLTEFSNLTAIITGANGMSGYHMVRVLASAPERWSKIYCLSRRSPPDNFFEDLGEGAKRVEHIPVDFLGEESEIAGRLRERIQKVYVLHNLCEMSNRLLTRWYV